MKVLFYLPVVTPWWFDKIVAPLVSKLTSVAEVHIVVPPLWRNTGIGRSQLQGMLSYTDIQWHIVDDVNHHSLRTSPTDPDGIVNFVNDICPDYIFCRSADVDTTTRFVGKLVHLVEGQTPPLASLGEEIIFQNEFWHHGAMPALEPQDWQAIDAVFADSWRQVRNRYTRKAPFRQPRNTALAELGLPTDRKVIALPLEYDHEESFTKIHNRFANNLELINAVAEELDDHHVLAVTDHPLNYKHVDNAEVYAAIKALGSRVHLIPNAQANYFTTDLLIKNCDGLIVQNTKAIYSGAFFGKPTARLSHRPTAGWLAVSEDIGSLLTRIELGESGASEDDARRWFGYHLMHETIDVETITAVEILERVDRPFARDRLASGLERFKDRQRASSTAL